MILTDEPLWIGQEEDKHAYSTEGRNVVLVCDVSMNPWGQFEWTFEGGELPSNAVQCGNVLTLLSVQLTDFGNYTCTASHVLQGNIHQSSYIIELIHGGPVTDPTDLRVEASTSVSVTLGWTCEHNGGDDNIWFELYIRQAGGEYEVYDDNIPADCTIGERNRPDYRVEGLESETEYEFQVWSRSSSGPIMLPATVTHVTSGRLCLTHIVLYDTKVYMWFI